MATKQIDYDRELAKIKLRVAGAMPFWGVFIHSDGGVRFCTDEEAAQRGCPGAVAFTDGKTIWCCKGFFTDYSVAEQEFILVHELLHKQHLHPLRHKMALKRKTFAGLPLNNAVLDQAMEQFVNCHADACRVGKRPAMLDKSQFYDKSLSFETSLVDIYRGLYKQLPPRPGQGQGNTPACQGSDLADPGEEPTEASMERSESEARSLTKAALVAAKQAGRGHADYQRWLEKWAEPKIDWRQHMAALFRPWVGTERLDFTRLNKRVYLRSGGLVLAPRRRGIRMGRLVVFVDTSGSIGAPEIKTFLGELVGILQDVRPSEVIVAGVDDCEPEKPVTITSVEDMPSVAPAITGGGGTDFRPPFRWIEKNDVNPEAVVYFTDLYGPYPQEAPDYPVFWACTTDMTCAWGETVRVEVDQTS